MNQQKLMKGEWKLDEILADPTFQKFVDGLFNCEQIKRISLLGSLVLHGRESFDRFPERPTSCDIDLGMEYKPPIGGSMWDGLQTDCIIEYCKQFGLKPDTHYSKGFRPVVYLPSPLAPVCYFGKTYIIHLNGKPKKNFLTLRER